MPCKRFSPRHVKQSPELTAEAAAVGNKSGCLKGCSCLTPALLCPCSNVSCRGLLAPPGESKAGLGLSRNTAAPPLPHGFIVIPTPSPKQHCFSPTPFTPVHLSLPTRPSDNHSRAEQSFPRFPTQICPAGVFTPCSCPHGLSWKLHIALW